MFYWQNKGRMKIMEQEKKIEKKKDKLSSNNL